MNPDMKESKHGSDVCGDVVRVHFRYWSDWMWPDPESETEGKWVYDILRDGTVKYHSCPLESRKVLDEDIFHVPAGKAAEFLDRIGMLCRPDADIERGSECDGCSYEMTVTFEDKQRKKFKGDAAGGTIAETALCFLHSIPGIKRKMERK